MSNTTLTFNSFVLVNFEGKDFEVHVFAKGNYFYQPCVMYFKDGTGQPEDEGFEVTEFEILKVLNIETGEELERGRDYDAICKDATFQELVNEALNEAWENGTEEWEFPEEPDCEPQEPWEDE